jgi:polysaccharide biosynthesis/export protein
MHARRPSPRWHWSLLAGLCALATGCYHTESAVVAPPPDGAVPRELSKVVLPPYVIEIPDVLLVQAFVPPDNDKGRGGEFFSYPLTPQPVDGQHLVQMDGTINLGIYGTVQVAGLTVDQARERIRAFLLQQTGRNPNALQVVVSVIAYNSKFYYVITDGAGYGEQVYQIPTLGNETVLDAIAKIGGLPQVASKRKIWVARRSPHGGPDQILPVCWEEITKQGITATNYQVLPGDRVYVNSQTIVAADNWLAKFLSPVERIFGVTLLGAETVQSIQGRNISGGTTGR